MALFTPLFLSLLLLGIAECIPKNEPQKMQLEKYCNSFKTCKECKSAEYPCDWCHKVGCTGSAHHYCPKVFLQSIQAKSDAKLCPRIDAGEAVFTPANIRTIMKVNITTNDWDVANHRIVCTVDIDYKTIQGAGTVHGRTLYCDMAEIKMKRDVMVGKLRVTWGGADPISNSVLVVVYRCEGLAGNCADCRKVHEQFDCGWCEESTSCTLLQHCPRQFGKWSPKNSRCNDENAVQKAHPRVKTHTGAAFKTF